MSAARIDMRQTRTAVEIVAGVEYRRIEPPPPTALGPAAWCDAIAAGACLLAITIPPPALEVLWAQYALETGRGARCYGWNLGNEMRPAGSPCDWCELATFEWVDPDGAGPRRVERVDTIACFKVFPSAAEGARAYLELLRRPRYAPAFQAALSGNPQVFAAELKARGYYTAPVDQYAAAVASLAREARAELAGLEVTACELPPALWPVEYEPIPATWSAATPLRAGEGEYTIRPNEDPL